MKITNHHGLHPVIVEAIRNTKYSRGGATYSATDMTTPPLLYALKRRHWDEIEEDVADLLFSLHGQAVHYVLEKAAKSTDVSEAAFSEIRLFADLPDGERISGQADMLDAGGPAPELWDWKTTSVWAVIDCLKNGVKPEWKIQTNIYAWLARRNGGNVSRIMIGAFMRDWSRMKALHDSNYPQTGFAAFEVPLWTDEKVEAHMSKHVSAIKATIADLEAGRYPSRECTAEEKWQKPTTFAIKKPRNKRASKVCASLTEAEEWKANAKGGDQMIIEVREGEAVRCEGYCPVKDFCPQYAKWNEEYGNDKSQEK